MTTSSSSSNPSPNKSSNNSDNSKQRLIAIAAVIIVALLGINIFLVASKINQGKVNDQLTEEVNEANQLKKELEEQYYEALSELEEMRGSNEELNALIEQQKSDLADQKSKIDGMLADSRNLSAARKELKNLRAQVDQYLAEINQLRSENEELASSNAELTETNTTLSTDLESARFANDELSTAQAQLMSEKDELTQTNNFLSTKVTRASVIQVAELEANGLKSKKGGKAVKKKYAKNIDQMQICFNTTANEVTEHGSETFYLRVINPLGETLAVENLGSGSFDLTSTGEEVRYTLAKEVNYDGDTEKYCMTWSPNQPFSKGTYEVEMYNKGYMAGSTTLTLK